MDSFTETTRTSWFSRLGKSLGGIFVGLALFLAAFPVLVSNERSEVRRIKGLNEGMAQVITVPADRIDPSNEGKLVLVSGTAVTEDILRDPEFGLAAKGVRLERTVEMFQWRESSSSETKTKLGGGTETVTTYRYDKAWSSGLVSSSSFKQPAGHANPSSFPVTGKTWTAQTVTLGSFSLNPGQIARVGRSERLGAAELEVLPATVRRSYRPAGDVLYRGIDPSNPQVGDVRVSFSLTRPGPVTVAARQSGGSFDPFPTRTTTIDLLKNQDMTSEQIFEASKNERYVLSWILRVLGLLMMVIGLTLILKPVSTVMDVIPLLGRISGGLLGFAAFLLGLGFAFITISIAWVAFRPLVGIPLLAAGLAVLILPRVLSAKRQTASG